MSNQLQFSIEYGTPLGYLKKENRINTPKKVLRITGDMTNSYQMQVVKVLTWPYIPCKLLTLTANYPKIDFEIYRKLFET